MRTVSERTRSRYDHNRPAHALANPALRVQVTRERLPQADYRTRVTIGTAAWDQRTEPVFDRAEQHRQAAAGRMWLDVDRGDADRTARARAAADRIAQARIARKSNRVGR